MEENFERFFTEDKEQQPKYCIRTFSKRNKNNKFLGKSTSYGLGIGFNRSTLIKGYFEERFNIYSIEMVFGPFVTVIVWYRES